MNQVLEYSDSLPDQQAVGRSRSSVRGPHDAAELGSRVQKSLSVLSEEILEQTWVVDRI